ncbi:hypothetical protein BABINDRAFT_5616 [Babjeviella inositovora NRRL Y-12698]|uniref:Uncharacterized protein n=1 Tax=Babjeviella inositovora NRRL Y-12698 TaxID=984486 RepID=A0A1E3R017_9ASCO|nr:uncharacterized protein BABINDRAFT_5616 [Babjeviella inositovora NRRL Y-12698]ODQ82687.1 hypothetical protein BABINDRAFT_5616 [Babjeviella inositovora NRRL Y-12698]
MPNTDIELVNLKDHLIHTTTELEFDEEYIDNLPAHSDGIALPSSFSQYTEHVIFTISFLIRWSLFLLTVYFPKYYFDKFQSMYYRQPYTTIHWILLVVSAKVGPSSQDGLTVTCLCVFITGSMLLWPLQVSYVAFCFWLVVTMVVGLGKGVIYVCNVLTTKLERVR